MKTVVNKKKQLIGLFFGMTAGLSFAVFAWGIDGFLLSRANGAYPYVKFIPGLLISMLSGGFVGWLTVRINNLFLSLGLWIGFSLLLSKLFIWLPIKATPMIIGLFDEHLGDFLKYPTFKELDQIRWVGFVAITIGAILSAILENLLIDQALFTSTSFALSVPIIISFLLFSLVGNSIDELYNKHIREPIQTVDTLLQFARDSNFEEVSPEIRREMHLSAVNTIIEYLPLDRKLIMSNFDNSFGQIDILVKFNSKWVKCTTIYNQVTNCKIVFDPPKNFFADILGELLNEKLSFHTFDV